MGVASESETVDLKRSTGSESTSDFDSTAIGEHLFSQVPVRELVETMRGNVTIDWTTREDVRMHLRLLVKRILRTHRYQPDKQEKATQTVLGQAEVCRGSGQLPENGRT